MTKTIYDLVNAKEVAAYWTKAAENAIPYLGKTLFPPQKQMGLDLSWIKGHQGLPVALTPSAFDAKATVRDRIGVKRVETEMPFFRESMRIGEKDRQEINRMLSAANEDMLTPLLAKIFDDVANLIRGAEVQAERMRMKLLSTGKIQITSQENRMTYNYDYKLPGAHKTTIGGASDKWSDTAQSDPIGDIKGWQDTIEDNTGVRPNKAICTRKTFNYLLANDSIRKDLNPVGHENIIVTDNMILEYLNQKLNLSVTVYNKKFSLEVGGGSNLFFPDDVFTLLPDGKLGNTYYGTTPEESDLMTGGSRADVRIVDTGVAVTSYMEEHPVNVVNLASAIVLPSFEAIDTIFVATVHS